MAPEALDENKKSQIKARFWEVVFYPEGARSDWSTVLPDIVQLPFAYCVHDKDSLSNLYTNDVVERKTHVHIILVFDGPTTRNKALSVVNALSMPGKKCAPVAIPVVSIKRAFEYLIHNTEPAKKANKYQYPKEARITGNNFDIGLYYSVSNYEKEDACDTLAEVIMVKKFTNFACFYAYVLSNDNEEHLYRNTVRSYSGFFERLIKGVYNQYQDEADRKLKGLSRTSGQQS